MVLHEPEKEWAVGMENWLDRVEKEAVVAVGERCAKDIPIAELPAEDLESKSWRRKKPAKGGP